MSEQQLNSLWNKRLLGIHIDNAAIIGRIPTIEDIRYVSNVVWPYVQIIKTPISPESAANVQFVTASTGWIIHYYGNAISTSLPHDVFKTQKHDSMIMQQVRTAEEIAALVEERGWQGAELIAGSKRMQRYLWMALDDRNLVLGGFTPTPEEALRRETLKKLRHTLKESETMKASAPLAPE